MAILSTFGAIAARGFGWVANLATGAGLYAWGDNSYGQLGTSNTTNYSSPVQVGALTTWANVMCGTYVTSAIKTDGTLWMWGANYSGQLGQGNTTSYSSPVQVGTLTTWATAYPIYQSIHVIKTNGTLWAWGDNSYGYLGTSNTTSYSSPVQVGALTTWASATKGFPQYTALAIKTDGTLWAWGWGTQHNGGNSGSAFDYTVSTPTGGPPGLDKSSPVQIGAATDWARTASGQLHALAIKTNGELYAWGDNRGFECGNDVFTNPAFYFPSATYGFCNGPDFTYYSYDISAVQAYDSTYTICGGGYVTWTYNSPNTSRWGYSSPVQVGALTTWSRVAAGQRSSYAIKTNGTLWAWGQNSSGQLGTSNTAAYSSPVQVGALTTWADVFGGNAHCVAIKTDGTLWAWGFNGAGQLGQGNTTNRSSPVQVGTATNWLSTGFSSGTNCMLAIRS